MERVRTKMRRMGLIDHISRFSPRLGYREGWILSAKFEHALRRLTVLFESFKHRASGSQEKDELLIAFAASRLGTALPPRDTEQPITWHGSNSTLHPQVVSDRDRLQQKLDDCMREKDRLRRDD